MRLIYGDIFCPKTYRDENGKPFALKPEAICITVNSFVKRDGAGVFGRGCAKQAADRWPWITTTWGKLAKQGAGVSVLGEVSNEHLKHVDIIAFPVKDKSEICQDLKNNIVEHMRAQFNPGDLVPGWACKARVDIIKTSLEQLKVLAKLYEYSTVVLVRPGVGFGELSWDKDIKELVEILPDNFFIISNA